jgi:N-acetylglucosamine kinase-like BadF-type ATPase
MTQYFLGVDIGGTKSHALIADASGNVLGFSKSGSGNPRIVGYRGLSKALHAVTDQAMATAGISKDQISGVGIGIAGYNWPSERETFLHTVHSLELLAPLEIVNDTIIGLLAGTEEGWGVAVVAGTSCNCRGRNQDGREGRVTGCGLMMGEAAGGIELLAKARQAIAFEWTRRGPPTSLTQAFIKLTGAQNIENLVEGLTTGFYKLCPEMVAVIFQVADEGDPVARDVIIWAGEELGSMAIGVIHQLGFETLTCEVVLVGSLFKVSSLLVQTVGKTINKAAPDARLVRLSAPPVVGGVLLGMEKAGMKYSSTLRKTLLNSTNKLLKSQGLDEPC